MTKPRRSLETTQGLSTGQRLAKGWYDNTVGGFINLGKAIYDTARDVIIPTNQNGNFKGGSFGGAGYTSRWKPAYKSKSSENFNAAFDEARNAGAETFMFGDKEYSTLKEANPIREFNNRYVGSGRTEEHIRNRNNYGIDYGPLTGKYSYVPRILYNDGGSIHIKPSKKGTFTAAATKHGMSVQEFANRVLKNKEDYSPSLVKKANFARNASKWH